MEQTEKLSDATMYCKEVDEAFNKLADHLASSFKLVDAKDVYLKLVEGDLPTMLTTYAECLNEVALMHGRGYSYNNARLREVERLVQSCEEFIAKNVLKNAGWETVSPIMYYKKQKNKE